MNFKLLSSLNSNSKLEKSNKIQDKYLNVNMYMHPSSTKICPYQDIAKCKEPCLNTAGLGGVYKSIQDARKRKTDLFLNDRDTFMEYIIEDITKFVNYCDKKGKLPAVRLNGTSDIQWETIKVNGKTIFEIFPTVQFYDYTKIPTRKTKHISNYHLTWSYSEANQKYADKFSDVEHNKAVVFNTKTLPSFFKGLKVIDGDTHDMRFLDEDNVVVGLRAKGKAKTDTSGFVIQAVQI
jgi:transcriptional regulator with PAS, ATPase and Fis domain